MLSNEVLNRNLNDSVGYEDYFKALGYSREEAVYLRMISDRPPKSSQNRECRLYDLVKNLPELHALNRDNSGIFYVVNGGGQKDNQVRQGRALFIDFDDFEFEEQIRRLNQFEHEPSIIVRTRKSLHCYWILAEGLTDLTRWTGLQKRLIKQFGSDPVIHNPSRVMRLYGFNHCKGDPVLVRLLKFDPDLKYSVQDFKDLLPELEKPRHTQKVHVPETIREGDRNNTLFRLACSLQSQGLTDSVIHAAVSKANEDQAGRPLSGSEVDALIKSALKYQKGTPERAHALEPDDYSDIGQAAVFNREYGDRVRFSEATGFLYYDGVKWAEDPLKVQALAQELTGRQLKESKDLLRKAQEQAIDAAEEGEEGAGGKVKDSRAYFRFILKERKSAGIAGALSQVKPMVQVKISDLDTDPYLLNTPDGAVNLRTGQIRENRAGDYCTKVTAVGPSEEGADLFSQFLKKLTGGNEDLICYLQRVAGMCAVGTVKQEKLIIAVGEGGNGKSTFFNLLFRVFGDYAGTIRAEILTTGKGSNKQPELAELRGKRLIIAAELEDGTRMDTATVKKLCSTDPIHAEKKYKDPFHFMPSHTLILYTNHMPKVGTIDTGTWDRIIAIPFTQKLRGASGEVKNYAEYLFDHAGGAVLSWIIEGAAGFIEDNFMLNEPGCVTKATEKYKEENNWLGHFIEDCCETGKEYSVGAAVIYRAYKVYCSSNGEYQRNSTDFKNALESAGYRQKKASVRYYCGIKLKPYCSRS